MLKFKPLLHLTDANYQRIANVFEGFTLNKMNENLHLKRWEAYEISGQGVDLLIIWQIIDGWMHLLGVHGTGIAEVAQKLKEIAKLNGLKGVELEAETEAHKRFYEGFGLSVHSYNMRVAV